MLAKNNLIKEISRDLLALGSIPFYFIVIIRSLIGDYFLFTYQLIIAGLLSASLSLLIKNKDYHLSFGLILVTFTSIFYKDILFSTFAIILYLLMIISYYYLNKKIKNIINSIIIGSISAIVSYYLSNILVG